MNLKNIFAVTLLTLFIAFGSQNACAQGNPEKEKTERKAKKAKKPKKVKNKPNIGDTVEIEPMKSLKYSIKPGQIISYTYKEHGSVGIYGEYSVSNNAVLIFKEQNRVFKNPNNEGMSGADEARVTLYFAGGEKGKTVLNLKEMFRGKAEKEYKVEITVE